MGDGRAGLQAAGHVLGQFDRVDAEIGGGLFDGNDAPHALYYACKHKVFSFLGVLYGGLNLNWYGVASPRLAVLSVLSAASPPCPDLNLIHCAI